jgi:lipopolysaccharide/colanic/teichoic acid biosynthesis glycosyltransferase
MPKTGPEYLNSKGKRSLDIIGAATVGLALVPAGAVAYTAAAIDNRSLQPFFRHERVGSHGNRFTLTKLKTLKSELVVDNLGRGPKDPRATGIGRMLRRYGLDEIPQIQSILEGEMSLLGIRPTTDAQIKFYEEHSPRKFGEWFSAYEAGRQGLIGPAQIFRRKLPAGAVEDVDTFLQMDIDYVKNACLWRDVAILGSAPLKLLEANIRQVPEAEETVLPAQTVY